MSVIIVLPSGSQVTASPSGDNGLVTLIESGVPASVITINQGQQGPAGVSLHYVQNYGDNRLLSSDGTPSGIYAETNLSFDGSQLSVGGIPVSISGHLHTSSEIVDFNSSVSGLLPSVTGTGYVTSSFANNIYTVDVTGLQPSGNYSVVGHTHTANNITDFNSSVSGILPSVSGSEYAVSSFVNNIYTISVTGLQPSGSYASGVHTHISSDIIDLSGYVSSGVNTYLTGLNIISNNCDKKYIVIQDISNNTKLVSISGIAEALSVIDGGGVLYSGC